METTGKESLGKEDAITIELLDHIDSREDNEEHAHRGKGHSNHTGQTDQTGHGGHAVHGGHAHHGSHLPHLPHLHFHILGHNHEHLVFSPEEIKEILEVSAFYRICLI
ncbi:Copper-translocating p-type ATPase [Plakobranchus ocellatus]|uniref:Copper-translocating p-type ATPase n=1 Tax=Plakobranchus ocellatus TaxID=259542 RepID=A0AAV4AZR5_9GAST|nr:Copper-translocating p-type ATPase [Plakobranchus ocellatus]